MVNKFTSITEGNQEIFVLLLISKFYLFKLFDY